MPMPDRYGNSSSRDGDWLEDEIEGLETFKNGPTNTISEVYALMKGNRDPMPDRHFYQTKLQDQVTSTSPTFESNTVGKTKSEALEYFGFLQINGKWVDPDSEKATHEALNSHPDVANPLLPGMDSSFGPYILSKSEQSVVYAQFLDDEDDNQGDPRAFRISPETFAMLAEGAVKGEQIQHEVIKQPIQIRRGPRHKSKERAKLTIFTPQYCAETGEYMSPAYSVDENPIPLLSPQSVNMDFLPTMFSRSYPLEALEFKRGHYFDARVVNTIPAPSGSEHITSECIREALTIDGDPESGTCQINEIRDYINQLRRDCQAKLEETHAASKIRNELETEVDQLRVSTHLLRNQVTDMIEQARQDTQRRRIREHLGSYIEILNHRNARLGINVQKLNEKNEALREERDKYTTEQLDLRNSLTALCEDEKPESP